MSERKKVEPFSKQARDLEPGIYKHYKGGRYKVLDIGRNEHNLEEVVIYQPVSESEENDIWIRPLAEFLSTVYHNGEEVPRFKLALSEEEIKNG